MTYKLSQSAPFKYQLEAHNTLLSYPTRQDFVFDVVSYLIKVFDSKSKKFDPTNINFSTKTLKYIFGDKMNNDEFRERLKLIMKEMIEDSSLTKTNDAFVITESEFLKLYTENN